MEIKLQSNEILLQKLVKLKCIKGCNNSANYIIFQLGLYCTGCLSKVNDISSDHFVTLEILSKIIADITDNYQQNNKTGRNLLSLKVEAQIQNKQIKHLRDALTVDIKSIYSKSNTIMMIAVNNCQKAYRNQAIQNFFQADISATILLNQTELLLKNLQNLIVVNQHDKISYRFDEKDKNPQEQKKKALSTFKSLKNTICQANTQTRSIMTKFKESIKN